MSIRRWQQLLTSIAVDGTPHPVSDVDLDAFETEWDNRLPLSYRNYCNIFGPGELAGWYNIATPNYQGNFKERYDLTTKNTAVHEGRDWREYSPNPEQFNRALIFADDTATAVYFWDPAEASMAKDNEYAIYAMYRDWTLQKLCDTFCEFIDICLHRGGVRLYDESPMLKFRAAMNKAPRTRRNK
jgi:SMI1/KNR4 family protein SUKH-1